MRVTGAQSGHIVPERSNIVMRNGVLTVTHQSTTAISEATLQLLASRAASTGRQAELYAMAVALSPYLRALCLQLEIKVFVINEKSKPAVRRAGTL